MVITHKRVFTCLNLRIKLQIKFFLFRLKIKSCLDGFNSFRSNFEKVKSNFYFNYDTSMVVSVFTCLNFRIKLLIKF